MPKRAPRKPKAIEAGTSAPKTRKRRPEDVKARVLAAALESFASHGFEGASTRTIAEDARVSLSLLLYHFGSKDKLWRAVIDDAMIRYPNHATDAGADTAPVKERLHEVIRAMVVLFSEIPALHRVITQEAHRPTPRLIWLCETYAKPDFKFLCDLLAEGQREGIVRNVAPMRLRFAMVAIAAVPFSVAAEYQYLAERNPFSAAEIEGSIELIERLVFEDEPRAN